MISGRIYCTTDDLEIGTFEVETLSNDRYNEIRGSCTCSNGHNTISIEFNDKEQKNEYTEKALEKNPTPDAFVTIYVNEKPVTINIPGDISADDLSKVVTKVIEAQTPPKK